MQLENKKKPTVHPKALTPDLLPRIVQPNLHNSKTNTPPPTELLNMVAAA